MQRLSRGGMGEIFLAKHGLAGFEKLAVIKKVLPHLAADASFISRFVDEAQVAIKLQHVNVAQVFEVGRVGNEYFLALEYVEGRDLRRTLALLTQRTQRLPVDLALFIGREMANGLAYAHRRTSSDGASLKLVHCDISPPNVLVSFEGETKVIDFGIAKSAIRGTATDPKMGFGKFGYMAPEQLIRGGVVDHRTDIYAGGVVLYEVLTGKRLYEAGNEPDYRALARKVAKGEHALPSECDPALATYDDLVATALRPRPEDRYQSAAELRDAIQQCLAAINPTISTDQLGAYMRDLFSDEMTAQRELHDRVAKAHLADFQDQLTQSTQSIGTVTFALANLALGEVVGPAVPGAQGDATRTTPKPAQAAQPAIAPQTPRARAQSVPPPLPGQRASGQHAAQPQRPTPNPTTPPGPSSGQSPAASVPDLSLADGTGTIDQIQLEPARRSRAPLIAIAIGVVLVGGLVSWAMTRGGEPSPPTDSKPVASAASGGGSGATPVMTVQPIDPATPPQPPQQPPSAGAPNAVGSAGSNLAVGSADGPTIDAQPPILSAPPPPPHAGTSGNKRHPPPPPHHPTEPKPPAITQQQVNAKFGAAVHEYKAYKDKYGMRLDAEWDDLAVWMQNHGAELDEASRRIDSFRSKLH
nr:serine/threonine-protein kinase [Kofleriaceae bacterium]